MALLDSEDPDRRGKVTYVLVHGAWRGGWVWQLVAELLQRAGHAVHAPTFAGADLDADIQQLVTLLQTLRSVILVGHSYGGMVITGATDRVPERIRRLVYFDAFVPEDGKCLLDYAVPERAARFRDEGGRTGSVMPPPLALWGLLRAEHIQLVQPRERQQPFGTMAQPVRLKQPALLACIPKTFVYCSAPATGSFDQFAVRYRRDRSWIFREIASGHDAMILAPAQSAQVLLEQAGLRT
jgi:pimeloyl-ACP methyl ester carboxylesterase